MAQGGASAEPFDTSDNTEEEMASATAVSLRIPASPFSPPLLQQYMDQRHPSDLTGELRVGDILQVVFLFLAPARETLFAVSSVSRAWRDRAEFLPQWALLGLVRNPHTGPSHEIMSAYRSTVTGRRKRGAVCASRTEVVAERVAVLRRRDEEAWRRRMDALWWWLLRFLGVSTAVLLPAGTQIMSCRVALWVMNSSSKRIHVMPAGISDCAMGLSFGQITTFPLEILALIVMICWSRRNFGARVESLLWLQFALGGLVAAVVLPTITGLQTDAINLQKMQDAPNFTLSPCPAYDPFQPPYYVTFTADAPSSWIFDTAPPVPVSSETDRVLVAFLRLISTACRGNSGFGAVIGVIVPPGGLSADWWEALQRNHSNRTLTFRTTRWHPAFPLPWYMYPAQPWDRVVPARWLPGMVPVIGALPVTSDDLPGPRIAYLERVIWALTAVACVAHLLTGIGLIKGCLISVAITLLAVSFATFVGSFILGACCLWTSASIMAMNRAIAWWLFGAGGVGTVGGIVAAVIFAICAAR